MMDGYGRGYGFDMMGGGWLAGLLMLFFAALVVAGIVLLVVWIVRTSASPHGPTGTAAPPGARGHDEALAIVKRRYAAGEITKEQYEEMIRTLSG